MIVSRAGHQTMPPTSTLIPSFVTSGCGLDPVMLQPLHRNPTDSNASSASFVSFPMTSLLSALLHHLRQPGFDLADEFGQVKNCSL